MSKPSQEQIAAANLTRQGYDYYLPRIKQAKPGRGVVIEPLFRRYLFIFTDGRWYSLQSTRGLSHVLMGEGGPQVVQDQIIASIRAREGPDGLICLAQPPKFSRGQKVRVDDGPFAGHFAKFQGMEPRERCQVLLNWLGGQVKVVLDERVLAAA